MGSRNSFVYMALGALTAPWLAGLTPAGAADSSTDQPLDEIVVTATLRSVPLQQVPGSISVLSGKRCTMQDRSISRMSRH